LSKVYAALGSGIVFSLISGKLASHGIIPLALASALLVLVIIVEFVMIFMPRTNKFSNIYLKPGIFYSWALIFGSMLGNLYSQVDSSDKKLYF